MKKERNDKFRIEEDYINNFHKVTKDNGYSLTPKTFNQLSEIKVKGYTNHYKNSWLNILKKFGKYDIFIEMLVKDLKIMRDTIGSISFDKLCKFNDNYTHDFLLQFDKAEINAKIEVFNFATNENQFRINFYNVKEIYNRIPLYTEFVETTKIPIASYITKFKLQKPYYDNIVKMYVSKEEYDEYINIRKQHKSKIGKQTGSLSAIHSLDDLKSNFIQIFEFCKEEYGGYPSRRFFETLSKIDTRTYRKRLNKSWLDICEMYGYKIERNHKAEKLVLNYLSKILNSTYKPQKTWNWLIGVGGKNMFCDGYFEDYNLVVEFDGISHRKPVKNFGGNERFIRTQENDKLKDKLLVENNINLLRIDSRDNWHDKNYLIEQLKMIGIDVISKAS